MADIFTGKGLTLQYNTDTGNRSPQGVGNITVNEVNTFPILTIHSETNTFDTYDSEYNSVLLSDKSVEPFQIVVNYLPDDSTHMYLDEMADSQGIFQCIIQYELNMDESTITYAIVNGYITGTQLSGDKDSVVTKSYTFTPQDVIARMSTMAALLPIYQGDYGVGSNTTDVPQYSPLVPTGNSFIKVPSTQAGNPAGADMMGIGLVDGTSVAEFAMTKTGTLSLYAKNATTAWTRIYTATQMDARYVPLTRTINGKPLSTNLTLDDLDVYAKDVVDDLDAETLKKASNLSDVASVESAKVNLGVNKLQQLSASTNLNYPTKNAALVLRDSDLAWGVFDSTANQWSALGVGQGGTGSITAAGARSNLGLGTAAIQNVGTSGATVPLLNGANVFSGATRFDAPQTSFAQTSTSSGNGIEIGSTTTAALSYMDLHSSGNATDYDVRIYASGGSTTTGQGNLTINAGSVTMPNLALSTDLAILHGGTGASTYDQALVNLNAMKFQRSTLGASDNLNDYNGANPGFYYCATNANATTANNYPVTQAGSLVVMRNGANGAFGCTQLYSPYNSNDIYVRTGYAGTTNTWSEWNIILQQGSFNIGAINSTTPPNATNMFFGESDGATTWAQANGAGFQSSYANNRLFQFIMTTSNRAYIRYNDSGDAKVAKTTKPWTELLTTGSYGLGVDLSTTSSTPIANLNESTPTGFYYTTNESTLGGVTSDTTYVLTNRGGRPTATASKYVQQRSWNGYYMGTSGWTWREQAQLESSQTWSGANTFNGRVVVAAPAAAPFTLSSVNPCIQFNETDTASNYTMVADGGNWRMNLNNTGGANIINYDRAKNDLTLTSGSIVISGNAAGTSANVSTGGFRGIEPGLDYAGFDNMNNVNITSWYGIGFCTAYNIPTNGVVAGKPAVYINTRNGTLAAKNAVYANTTQLTSDRNAKDNIVEIEDESIEKYLNLKTYTFEFKNSGQTSAGFIAQEVQDVFPDFVQFVDDIGHLTLDYNAMTAHTHRALVAVNEKVKEQATKIETLENSIQDQQVQIDELKALVQSLLDNK